MRRIAYLSCCLLLLGVSVFAQSSKVRVSSLLLTQEKTGWRVNLVDDGTASEHALQIFQTGGLLISIDTKDAGRLGALAVLGAFNEAFSRAVPLTVKRATQLNQISLWRDDGPAPTTKPPTESVVSATQEAPDFTLPTLNDVPVKLASQRGRWVLVSFWATWCAPCQEEAKILNKLAQAYPQQLTVLALAVKDSRKNLNEFVEKVKPAYTILDAGPLKAQPALAYGVGTPSGGGHLPVNVLVQPDGRIAYAQGGYQAPSPLERQVSDAIAGK
jgi:peroxiredoxin